MMRRPDALRAIARLNPGEIVVSTYPVPSIGWLFGLIPSTTCMSEPWDLLRRTG